MLHYFRIPTAFTTPYTGTFRAFALVGITKIENLTHSSRSFLFVTEFLYHISLYVAKLLPGLQFSLLAQASVLLFTLEWSGARPISEQW